MLDTLATEELQRLHAELSHRVRQLQFPKTRDDEESVGLLDIFSSLEMKIAHELARRGCRTVTRH